MLEILICIHSDILKMCYKLLKKRQYVFNDWGNVYRHMNYLNKNYHRKASETPKVTVLDHLS